MVVCIECINVSFTDEGVAGIWLPNKGLVPYSKKRFTGSGILFMKPLNLAAQVPTVVASNV